MRTFTRLSLIAGVAVLAQAAFATINYNVIEANVSYNNGDSNSLTWTTDNNAITFTSTPPIGVGDGFWAADQHAAATVTIIYTVTSDKPLTGLDLLFDGTVKNFGEVDYTELVENWSQGGGSGSVIASVSGSYTDPVIGDANANSFSDNQMLNFGQQEFSYKVKKTFTLTDSDPTNLTNSYATIGFVEQNAVPEPASMGALAIGALGLLARRKRK